MNLPVYIKNFVLGFMAASILFSFFINTDLAVSSGKLIKTFSGFWFNLAFISIGIETRFSDLKNAENKRPIYCPGFKWIYSIC